MVRVGFRLSLCVAFTLWLYMLYELYLLFFLFSTNYFFLHLVLKTAKSWSGCLVVSNKSFSFATE